MLDRLSLQCSDLATNFGQVIGYGTTFPDFWLGGHENGEGFRESHIAFVAPAREAVQAFFDAAVTGGAEVLHAPRLPRP